ncbi:MAG: hypothetical protein ACJAZW_002011 [Maritalea sp.]|jgi:hypothetical protein
MKQITTPQLKLALKALEQAEAECELAQEQSAVFQRQRENAPRPALAAGLHPTLGLVALTTVQNKKRMRQGGSNACHPKVEAGFWTNDTRRKRRTRVGVPHVLTRPTGRKK